ncbi:MAG: hypothetical protein HZC41_25000 [Chloroflexi bacterium]|nr:hypothetical protein [Chloroflexota bacterium]
MKPILTPAQMEAQRAAEQARLEHAARREEHLRRLCAPRPLEDWAQQRIQAYWRDVYKESSDARKTA